MICRKFFFYHLATDSINPKVLNLYPLMLVKKLFKELKQRLTSMAILIVPNDAGGFAVSNDACPIGLACVMMQNAKGCIWV